MDLTSIMMTCAPMVAHSTAMAVVHVESGGNPHAIGVVDGYLVRQPRNRAEAVATAHALEAAGMNYSVGLGQINRANFARFGFTLETAFEPCANLRAMQVILAECFERAVAKSSQQHALRQAFSCYYSGNFSTGFKDGYVDRVIAAWRAIDASNRIAPTTRREVSNQ